MKKRRSYGYVDKNQKHQENTHSRHYGDIKTDTPARAPQSAKAFSVIFDLLRRTVFFVFQLIRWVFQFILGLFGKRSGRSSKRKPGKFSSGNFKKKLFKWSAILVGVGVVFVAILTVWVSKDLPDPDRLTDRNQAQSTKIYDRTGEHLLYEIFAEEKRTLVELDQLPDHLVNGLIATEDKKFYDHHGIRPLSILRALVTGLFSEKRVAGASTLTQQLVKNAILTNERSIIRKIKEAILSIQIERRFTKEQILKIYFNEIPYGSTNYGVQAAAKSYFNKDVSALTLAESATLAGMPKAPSTYLNDLDNLKLRRNIVLRRMFEEGYITEAEKLAAQAQPLEMKRTLNNIKAPHFVLDVKEQLVQEFGEVLVETGGLKVITTLDWDKQQIAEHVMEETAAEVLTAAGGNNAALLSMDPRNGHVLAMVGSQDYFNDDINGQFNVVTLGRRQPGSSFKPIVYAAAFEKGFTPNTLLFDVLTNFSVGGSYVPQNYSLTEYGPITMREALQGSLNISAVKTMYLVGQNKTIEFAKRLGYTTFDENNYGLSLVLGGGEVNMVEHVSAYGALANYGIHHEPTSILRVEDSGGDVLKEWEKSNGERAIEPWLAAGISNVLSDDGARAYAFGTGGILTLPGRPVAAKTGTTNEYKDGWTIGYTPSLVTGVWGGNTDNTPMKPGYGGSRVAGPIWNAYMREALKDSPVEGFPAPPAYETDKAVLNGAQGGAVTLKVDKVTGKLATSSTPEKYIEERAYILPHSILHYVNKDDPQAEIPENPGIDPQYAGWEAAIQSWIERKKEEDPDWNVSFEEPPTEYDDAHSLELIPTLNVVIPAPGSTMTSDVLETDIRVSAPRGVAKVTYKLDGVYVGVVEEHPFNLKHDVHLLEPGEHTLTIIVEDDVGNRLEEEVVFILDIQEALPGVSWEKNSVTLGQNEFPKTLLLNHHKLSELERVDVSVMGNGEQVALFGITDLSNQFDGKLIFSWSANPGQGGWELHATPIFTGGGAGDTDVLPVTVQ